VVNLKILAGIPDRVHEVVHFEVAHFEPIAVSIEIDGMYAAVAMSLPRCPGTTTVDRLSVAADVLHASDSILMEMILHKDQKALKRRKGMSCCCEAPNEMLLAEPWKC
jgi:hypothetical protein